MVERAQKNPSASRVIDQVNRVDPQDLLHLPSLTLKEHICREADFDSSLIRFFQNLATDALEHFSGWTKGTQFRAYPLRLVIPDWLAQHAGDIPHRAGFETVIQKTIDTIPKRQRFAQNLGGELPAIGGTSCDCQDLKATAACR